MGRSANPERSFSVPCGIVESNGEAERRLFLAWKGEREEKKGVMMDHGERCNYRRLGWAPLDVLCFFFLWGADRHG